LWYFFLTPRKKTCLKRENKKDKKKISLLGGPSSYVRDQPT
jgi:hypothetical protein